METATVSAPLEIASAAACRAPRPAGDVPQRRLDSRVWEMADGRLFVISDDPVEPAPGNGETLEGALGIDIEDRFYDEPSLADDVAIVVDSLTRPGG